MLRIILWVLITALALLFFLFLTRKKLVYSPRYQCKECRKVYDCCTCDVPNYCEKCGAQLFTYREKTDVFGFGKIENIESENLQVVIAKLTLKGWKIREVSHE